jgi:membrane-bound metal-dependent hydrolase YbcI (DUF457 family)
MDPLTHIVAGRAVVAAARGETRNRIVGAAAILGALAPDADSAIAFAGWDRYVRAHQFGTHSLLGALAMAGLAAVAVDRFVRARPFVGDRDSNNSGVAAPCQRARSGRPERAALRSDLLPAAAVGALSPIVLDLLSGARIAIAWPLLNRRVSAPLVAMADPWLLALSLAWLVMLWPARIRLQRASQIVVAAAVVFLCAKASLLGLAIERSGVALREPSALEARWGSHTEWCGFERLADRVRGSIISATGGESRTWIAHPLTAETPLVSASRALDDVRNFLAVHEFAFAEETPRADGATSVLWSDIRYCWSRPANETTGPTAITCGVRVGGVFDAKRRLVVEEVWIGQVLQRRPANP